MITGILIGIAISAGIIICYILATKHDLSHIPGVEIEIKKAEPTKYFKNGRRNVKQVIRVTNEGIGASGELVLKGAVYPKDLTTKE